MCTCLSHGRVVHRHRATHPSRAAHYDGLHLEENGLGMVRQFLQDWRKTRRKIPNTKYPIPKATLATGALFAPILREAADELARLSGVQLDVGSDPQRAPG